jgi:hypothetical protein
MNIPGLANYILNHLSQKPDDTAPQALLPAVGPSPVESCPAEILDQITSYLPITSVLTLSRTSKALHKHLPTQKQYRDAFITGEAVGYLWDLDESTCRAKAAANSWDWAQLARDLTRRDCFDQGKGFDDAPKGLRNRQRIWKILLDG